MTEPIRRMTDADRSAVLQLLRDTMGWEHDARVDEFFGWKHDLNPFGESPGWVGLDDSGEIVAVRILMNWRFSDGEKSVHAVRAVDTATHPSQQGKGWFTRLTLAAVADLTRERVGFVFNTPNDHSWPGYEKMGWLEADRPMLGLRPRRLASLPKIAAARVAADKWAAPVGTAPTAASVLDDGDGVESLLSSRSVEGFETERSVSYLRWRYGLASLGYQALVVDDAIDQGLVIYRVRRRGSITEASVCELLVPDDDRRIAADLVEAVLDDSGADTVLTAGTQRTPGTVPVPRLGPRVTTRVVAAAPVRPAWQLGDLELF